MRSNISMYSQNIFAADVAAEQPGRRGHAAGPGGGGGAPAAAAAPLAAGPGAAPQWMLDTHQHILRSDGFMVL